MKVYKITHHDGQETYLSCDLVHAEAPIRAGFDHGEEQIDFSSTPFQTAHAHHRLERAAELVLHYTDRESCAEDDDHLCDCARRIKSIQEV